MKAVKTTNQFITCISCTPFVFNGVCTLSFSSSLSAEFLGTFFDQKALFDKEIQHPPDFDQETHLFRHIY